VEGIKAVIERNPVAVVSDIRMPGHDGFWVLRKIRDIPSDVPVIFNSAYQDISLPGDLVGTYAPFGYVIKAAGIEQFLELVDKAAAARTA